MVNSDDEVSVISSAGSTKQPSSSGHDKKANENDLSSNTKPIGVDSRSFRDKFGVVKCTVCSKQLNPFIGRDFAVHPFLEVVLCKRCERFLHGEWKLDEDGKDEFCRWCGEGGEIFVCDFCPKGFCKACIKRNVGRAYFNELEKNVNEDDDFKWTCFLCDPSPVENLRKYCRELRQFVADSKKKRSTGIKKSHSPSLPGANSKTSTPLTSPKHSKLAKKAENSRLLSSLDNQLSDFTQQSTIQTVSSLAEFGPPSLKLSDVIDHLLKTSTQFSNVMSNLKDLTLDYEQDFQQSNKEVKKVLKTLKSALTKLTDSLLASHDSIETIEQRTLLATCQEAQNIAKNEMNTEKKPPKTAKKRKLDSDSEESSVKNAITVESDLELDVNLNQGGSETAEKTLKADSTGDNVEPEPPPSTSRDVEPKTIGEEKPENDQEKPESDKENDEFENLGDKIREEKSETSDLEMNFQGSPNSPALSYGSTGFEIKADDVNFDSDQEKTAFDKEKPVKTGKSEAKKGKNGSKSAKRRKKNENDDENRKEEVGEKQDDDSNMESDQEISSSDKEKPVKTGKSYSKNGNVELSNEKAYENRSREDLKQQADDSNLDSDREKSASGEEKPVKIGKSEAKNGSKSAKIRKNNESDDENRIQEQEDVDLDLEQQAYDSNLDSDQEKAASDEEKPVKTGKSEPKNQSKPAKRQKKNKKDDQNESKDDSDSEKQADDSDSDQEKISSDTEKPGKTGKSYSESENDEENRIREEGSDSDLDKQADNSISDSDQEKSMLSKEKPVKTGKSKAKSKKNESKSAKRSENDDENRISEEIDFESDLEKQADDSNIKSDQEKILSDDEKPVITGKSDAKDESKGANLESKSRKRDENVDSDVEILTDDSNSDSDQEKSSSGREKPVKTGKSGAKNWSKSAKGRKKNKDDDEKVKRNEQGFDSDLEKQLEEADKALAWSNFESKTRRKVAEKQKKSSNSVEKSAMEPKRASSEVDLDMDYEILDQWDLESDNSAANEPGKSEDLLKSASRDHRNKDSSSSASELENVDLSDYEGIVEGKKTRKSRRKLFKNQKENMDMAENKGQNRKKSDASDDDDAPEDENDPKASKLLKNIDKLLSIRVNRLDEEGGSNKKMTRSAANKKKAKKIVSSDEDDMFGNEKASRSSPSLSNHSSEGEKSDSPDNTTSSQSGSEYDSDDDFQDSDFKKKKRGQKSMKKTRQQTRNAKKSSKNGGKKKNTRKRIAVSTEDEDEQSDDVVEVASEEDEDDDDSQSPSKGGRKSIRKIKKASSQTSDAYEEEKERRKRLLEKQKLYNEVTIPEEEEEDSPSTSQKITSLVLDKDLKTNEVLVEVHPKLVDKLKPHQIRGVQFMYDCVIESVEKASEPGSGSILAHCMGLGKTFQVVTLLHTLLTHEKLGIKTALVLSPLNVVLNWEHEFNYWLENDELNINVWQLASIKNNADRAKIVDTWQEDGGVLILGYNLYQMLADNSKKAEKKIKKDKWRQSFQRGFINPGPDIIVCDEGHILKNEKTGISKVINRISTKRRICLTGTPLQNNLKEYYTMVQFVKPNLLGSKTEFGNRFENPIKNGQYIDSTPEDVRIMKRRAHILHKMLSGCVQRQDYTALAEALPPKYEYVLNINLSQEQIDLYKKYLNEVVGELDAESLKARRSLFADFQQLQRIWTHPYTILIHAEEMDRKDLLQEEKEFVNDDDEEESDSDYSVHDEDEPAPKRRKRNLNNGNGNVNGESGNKEDDDEIEIVKEWKTSRHLQKSAAGSSTTAKKDDKFAFPKLPVENFNWYGDVVKEEWKTNVEISGKMLLLFEILKKCESIGDKLLVFSQSLLALDLIEILLEHFHKTGWSAGSESLSSLYKWRWARDKDYFRLDGSTSAEKRKHLSKLFNDPNNLRARLFLISTRAGSLGMNLYGANRVVIFDTNWNPTHDTQSMFRVYRFGQTKPVYIYRFISHGTMEATIYDRGVTKQSLACRVVDEQQIDRHFLGRDLEALYEFKPFEIRNEKQKTVAVPKDRLLADLLFEQKKWILSYHEHDSLLQNLEEEQLTEEERKSAWEEYETERKNPTRRPQLTDKYVLFTNAMPVLKAIMEEGDRLIIASGEKVHHHMEAIVRNWINSDPIINQNPAMLITKTQQLVQKLREMVARKNMNPYANQVNGGFVPDVYPPPFQPRMN